VILDFGSAILFRGNCNGTGALVFGDVCCSQQVFQVVVGGVEVMLWG
jgi:hypothetical protein